MEPFVIHLFGLILLLAGANWFVSAGTGLARRFGMSGLIIGLTVIAFGTSLPETVVSAVASSASRGDVAIGNVLGSNLANVLLVIGMAAVIRPLPVTGTPVLPHVVMSILALLLVGFLANVSPPGTGDQLAVTGTDGAVLLLVLLLYLAYLKKSPSNVTLPVTESQGTHAAVFVPLLIAGALAVYVGARWVVDGTVGIAHQLGLSDASIALTVTAIGTSFPELVVSVVAAFRGLPGIAVGNAIGSNIFNLLWVVGVSAQSGNLVFSNRSNLDFVVVAFASAVLLVILFAGPNRTIRRWHGALMLCGYLGYLAFLMQSR